MSGRESSRESRKAENARIQSGKQGRLKQTSGEGKKCQMSAASVARTSVDLSSCDHGLSRDSFPLAPGEARSEVAEPGETHEASGVSAGVSLRKTIGRPKEGEGYPAVELKGFKAGL